MYHLDNMTNRDAYQMRKYDYSSPDINQTTGMFDTLQKCPWAQNVFGSHVTTLPAILRHDLFLGIPNSSQMSKQLTAADAFHDLGSGHSVGAWRVLGQTWGLPSKDKRQHKTSPPMQADWHHLHYVSKAKLPLKAFWKQWIRRQMHL